MPMLICGYIYVPALADAYTITVTADRTVPTDLSVGGDVNSNPSGISCTDGSAGVCSYLFTDGIEITLAANANWESNFAGWGTPCTASGTGPCVFTPTADAVVNATFSPNYEALILGHAIVPNFTTLTDAYAAALDQSTIVANANYTFHEDLTLNDINGKFIRLYLGKEAGFYYAAPIGFTTLQGTLTVQYGSVEIDSLTIQ
jgi:hypothetical protein